MKKVLFLFLTLFLTVASAAYADTLTSNRHFFLDVANDAGVKYNYDYARYSLPAGTGVGKNGVAYETNNLPGIANGTYFMKADGGGLNSNHFTTDWTNPLGQTTITSISSHSVTGSFYVNDTGGRAFTDDTILAVAVAGTVADNLSITVNAGGYSWTPNPNNGVAPTTYTYNANAFSETFQKSDLIYGPNNYKPGPGNLGVWSLPFYYGQDPTTQYQLMFIDLGLGMLKGAAPADLFYGTTNGGAVKVDFSINNLYGDVAFNMYGWMLNSNQGEGISFTNTTNSNTTSTGYVLDYTGAPYNPVPIPPAALLLASGLGGLFVVRRRGTKS